MRRPHEYRIAVCSWSLEPQGPDDLVTLLRATGQSKLQLALDPFRDGRWSLAETRRLLARENVDVVSGMMGMAGEDYSSVESIHRTGGVVPDETWDANRAAAVATAEIAAALELGLVTFHAGFVPEPSGGPAYRVVVDRVAEIATIFARRNVRVGLETGQESAPHLAAFLDDLVGMSVGVNFDPANLILYGRGDPVTALDRLAPFVLQVHIKDALPPVRRGEWGIEVPVGEGAIDWPAFFDALQRCPEVDTLAIEREAGDRRVLDITRAVGLLAAARQVGDRTP